MALNITRPKVSHMCWTTTCKSKIALRFAQRLLAFQIIEVFDFSMGYKKNDEFEIFEKNALKIGK